MPVTLRQHTSLLVALTLTFLFLTSPLLTAQDHFVSPAEMHQRLLAAASARQSNLAKVENFLSQDYVHKAAQNVHLNEAKIQQAISLLSDEELARLAVQTDKVSNDFAAGALTNQQITYILIALATAVIILVIVNAK